MGTYVLSVLVQESIPGHDFGVQDVIMPALSDHSGCRYEKYQ